MPEQHEELGHDLVRKMLNVARHLGASADLNEILALIIDVMRDTLHAERASVFEYDPETDELHTTVAHGLSEQRREVNDDRPVREIRIPTSTGIAGECVRKRRIINVPDAYADDRFNPEVDHQTGFKTRSMLTIPLLSHDGELVGVSQVLNKRGGPFDDYDEEIATALAAHAAVAMKRGRLIEDRLVREKLERDLQLARQIQQSTFPSELPTLKNFQLGAWSEPADQTGGDVYDIIGMPDKATGASWPEYSPDHVHSQAYLLMADATGHGVGPALCATQVRSMMRMAVRVGATLEQIANHMNQQLNEDLPPGRFVTTWLGELDAESGVLSSLSAGQAPLLHYRAAADVVDEYSADLIPLGVMAEGESCPPRDIQLQPGDMFIVISDGIYESENAQGKQFGIEGVMNIVRQHRNESPMAIIELIQSAVYTYTRGRLADDDRTGIIIKRRK